ENPNSEIKEKHFNHTINNITLKFTSVSGVFSFEQKIDKASELLIKNFSPSGSSLLDVGCGYGAIGLFLRALYPDQKVHMVDVNNRAIEYTRLNAVSNHLEVNAFQSDLFAAINQQKFDDIVTNPPIAAGKKLNIDLINQSFDYLNVNGSLWLVAFHNKGGSTLKDIMKTRFGNVEDIEKSGGIRVYKTIKKG
ncbi:MAG: methylase RsmC, partial [Clostridiales bacterium]|nr:methylase RsmC [Clostridiales bacterium]